MPVHSCLILCDPVDCSTRLLCPWNFPGNNNEMGCHFLLPTQGSNSLATTALAGRFFTTGPLEKLLCKFKKKSHFLTILSSVQFSFSVMSKSLQPHRLQHTRLPCPSPTTGASSDSCLSYRWWHPTISTPVVPFSSCPLFCLADYYSFNVRSLFSYPVKMEGAIIIM